MTERMARRLIAVRRTVLLVLGGILLAALLPASLVSTRLSNGGYLPAGAESGRVLAFLEQHFHDGPPSIVVLVQPRSGSVDDAAMAGRGIALTDAVRSTPGVVNAVSYWTAGRPAALRATTGTSALVLAYAGSDDDAAQKTAGRVATRIPTADNADTVTVTGKAELLRQVDLEAKKDLVRAEVVAGPLTLILLLLFLRSGAAMLLTVGLGVVVLMLASAAIYLISLAFPGVSVFALNLASTLGLGLSIDYALFVIARFREELDAGLEPHAAAARTAATAGRAVLFSAGSVAVAMLVLLVFPLPVLRSFAAGGVPAALIAGVLANAGLIPLLAALGRRVDRWSLGRRAPVVPEREPWYRLAHRVMARPVPLVTATVLVLLLIASPFLHLRLGNVDESTLPADNPARAAMAAVHAGYNGDEIEAFPVAAPGVAAAAAARAAAWMSSLPAVARVDTWDGSWSGGRLVAPAEQAGARFTGDAGTWALVVPRDSWLSQRSLDLVHTLRATAPVHLLVGGIAAETIDGKDSVLPRVPLALTLVAVTMYVLLLLVFGSALLPLKAIVLNLLSLSATMGALVFVFQDGHLAGPLGYTTTGTTWTVIPVLVFCVGFGLSMDYEVFLISRIKELHDAGVKDGAAIAGGLGRSGRIVTSAAVLISVVLCGLLAASVGIMKTIGLGMALAVLLDATIVRAILVPALMTLAGGANWWLPRRLHFVRTLRWHGDRGAPVPDPADA